MGKWRSIFILLPALLLSCGEEPDIEQVKNDLKRTDSLFAKMSETKGMHEAFLTYVDQEGVMLRVNNYPLKGKHQVEAAFALRPDTSFTLTWEPMSVDVAKGGDMGYTYGVYTMSTRDESGEPVVVQGTYVSVWKKDSSGNWKWVLDSGNQGLGAGYRDPEHQAATK
jgi:ketosteroid isomerase-like protein